MVFHTDDDLMLSTPMSVFVSKFASLNQELGRSMTVTINGHTTGLRFEVTKLKVTFDNFSTPG